MLFDYAIHRRKLNFSHRAVWLSTSNVSSQVSLLLEHIRYNLFISLPACGYLQETTKPVDQYYFENDFDNENQISFSQHHLIERSHQQSEQLFKINKSYTNMLSRTKQELLWYLDLQWRDSLLNQTIWESYLVQKVYNSQYSPTVDLYRSINRLSRNTQSLFCFISDRINPPG